MKTLPIILSFLLICPFGESKAQSGSATFHLPVHHSFLPTRLTFSSLSAETSASLLQFGKIPVYHQLQSHVLIPLWKKPKTSLAIQTGALSTRFQAEPVSHYAINPSLGYQHQYNHWILQAGAGWEMARTTWDPSLLSTGMQWDTHQGYLPDSDTGESQGIRSFGESHLTARISLFSYSKNWFFSYQKSYGQTFTLQKGWDWQKMSLLPYISFSHHHEPEYKLGTHLILSGNHTVAKYQLWGGASVKNFQEPQLQAGIRNQRLILAWSVTSTYRFSSLLNSLVIRFTLPPAPKTPDKRMAAGTEISPGSMPEEGKDKNAQASLGLEENSNTPMDTKRNLEKNANSGFGLDSGSDMGPNSQKEPGLGMEPSTSPGELRESFYVTLNFGLNKWKPDREDQKQLNKVVERMEKEPGLRLVVIGHSDYTGSEQVKQQISDRRARAVADYLIKKGIAPERLSAYGVSDSQPLTDSRDTENTQINRRIDFIFYQ